MSHAFTGGSWRSNMATPEAKASQEVKLRAGEWRCKLYRNNSGGFIDPNTGRLILFGLGNISKKRNLITKSSDNIGWTPVTITPEMVGKTIAVFTAFEDKTPSFKVQEVYREGSREAAQLKFINNIKHGGGIAGFTRSADDVDKILKEYLEWLIN
jgi:hypothetical protein